MNLYIALCAYNEEIQVYLKRKPPLPVLHELINTLSELNSADVMDLEDVYHNIEDLHPKKLPGIQKKRMIGIDEFILRNIRWTMAHLSILIEDIEKKCPQEDLH